MKRRRYLQIFWGAGGWHATPTNAGGWDEHRVSKDQHAVLSEGVGVGEAQVQG